MCAGNVLDSVMASYPRVIAVMWQACRPAGFVAIQKYGEKFGKAGKDWQRRRPVRLLYTGGNHYDLLIK